jgi:hypothetical protein
MEHSVIELDYSAISSSLGPSELLDKLVAYPDPTIVAVSAFEGVAARLEAACAEPASASLIAGLRAEHLDFCRALGAPDYAREAARIRLDRLLGRLWTLLACPAVGGGRGSRILGIGEELSATCTALALASIGRPAPIIDAAAEPGQIRDWPYGAVLPGLASAPAFAEAIGAEFVPSGRFCRRLGEPGRFTSVGRSPQVIARSPGVA